MTEEGEVLTRPISLGHPERRREAPELKDLFITIAVLQVKGILHCVQNDEGGEVAARKRLFSAYNKNRTKSLRRD